MTHVFAYEVDKRQIREEQFKKKIWLENNKSVLLYFSSPKQKFLR